MRGVGQHPWKQWFWAFAANGFGLLAVCCALALSTGGWLGLRQALAADPKVTKAVEVKPATREGRLVFWAQDGIRLIDPDGKNDTRVLDRTGKNPDGAVLSPDGVSLAWLDAVVPLPDRERPAHPVKKLYLRKLSEAKVREFAIDGQMLSWSPNGRELMVTCFHDGNDGPLDLNCIIVEAATGKQTAIAAPKDHIPTDIAPDGKGLIASTLEGAVVLLTREGEVEKTLSDAKYGAHMGRVSPDGKTLLFMGMKAAAKKADGPREGEARLYVQPVGGKAVELKDVPISAGLSGFCWSPDGKRIAYTWRTIHAEKAPEGQVDERETESHLCVCDADGGNHRTLVSEKGRGQYHITIGSVDWR